MAHYLLVRGINMQLYSSNSFPDWFEVPNRLIKILTEGDFYQGDYDFGPSWQLLRVEHVELWCEGLKKRYPKRKLYPFARRVGDDDVACFDLDKESFPPKVVIIHDFAGPGWEYRGSFNSFEDWLEAAKKETDEWE